MKVQVQDKKAQMRQQPQLLVQRGNVKTFTLRQTFFFSEKKDLKADGKAAAHSSVLRSVQFAGELRRSGRIHARRQCYPHD